MNLLIITQKVDANDPVLGFFHRWIEEFSKRCEKLTVICLQKGEYHLPGNVKVLSLGKEGGRSRLKYIFRFYKYIWRERKNYDVVFIHMNQEYVLLGWKLWRLTGKKMMLWRNHPRGNFLTDLAVLLSNKVFCTSKFSYTAKFKKTEIAPVGIDADLFKRRPEIKKLPNSVLFLGRISPIKNIDLLVDAFDSLNKEKFSFNALIVGDPVPGDERYFEFIKNKTREYGLEQKVYFRKAVSPAETVDLYNDCELFVNLTETGSMDKTIFEAMACESLVLTSNLSLEGEIDNICLYKKDRNLAGKIKELLGLGSGAKAALGAKLRDYAIKNHSLEKTISTVLR